MFNHMIHFTGFYMNVSEDVLNWVKENWSAWYADSKKLQNERRFANWDDMVYESIIEQFGEAKE